MHPEILRELTSQRGLEMRARARQAKLAQVASRARRATRRGQGTSDEIDGYVMPVIPDYVDGSFRSGAHGGAVKEQEGGAVKEQEGGAVKEQAAGSEPGQVPAARNAA